MSERFGGDGSGERTRSGLRGALEQALGELLGRLELEVAQDDALETTRKRRRRHARACCQHEEQRWRRHRQHMREQTNAVGVHPLPVVDAQYEATALRDDREEVTNAPKSDALLLPSVQSRASFDGRRRLGAAAKDGKR